MNIINYLQWHRKQRQIRSETSEQGILAKIKAGGGWEQFSTQYGNRATVTNALHATNPSVVLEIMRRPKSRRQVDGRCALWHALQRVSMWRRQICLCNRWYRQASMHSGWDARNPGTAGVEHKEGVWKNAQRCVGEAVLPQFRRSLGLHLPSSMRVWRNLAPTQHFGTRSPFLPSAATHFRLHWFATRFAVLHILIRSLP